jgi:predicted ArsR family transcriptional regulator
MKVNGQEYITVQEMAKKLGIPPNTVKQRLFQHDIKPVSKDALYELSALSAIKDTAMGRPKKTTVLEVKPKTKKSAKTKKI